MDFIACRTRKRGKLEREWIRVSFEAAAAAIYALNEKLTVMGRACSQLSARTGSSLVPETL